MTLGVTVGVIGGALGVAAPAVSAATVLPDVCAIYLQGTVDPAGGALPGSIIPLVPPANNHVYGVNGHLAKGQDKVLNDLNNSTLAGKRFAASLTLGGIVTGNTAENGPIAPVIDALNGAAPLPADAKTAIKLGWANDTTTPGATKFSTVQVAESSTIGAIKVPVAKGTVTALPGTDNLGPIIGVPVQGVTGVSSEVANLVVPKAATTGTYQLQIKFPTQVALAGPLAGVSITTANIAFNANAGAVQSALTTAMSPFFGPSAAAVTGTNFNAGLADGDYTITFQNGAANIGLPDLALPTPTTVTGDLATTMLDDGGLQNAKRAGGVDPSISPISDVGNGVYAATGVFSGGPVGGVAGKNTGKAGFFQDTQFTFIQYPSALVTAINANLANNGALPILAAITGLTTVQLGNNCGLGGLLAVFCVANSAVIPATFAGLCGAITTP